MQLLGPKSKEIKVKFFSFPWLGFPTFLSAFPNEFWISLNLCSLVWKMTFPMNFKGTLSQDLLGVQFCISLVIGMTALTHTKMRCKTVNFVGGQKLKVCFYLRYLYFNRLIGYVDLKMKL